MVGSIVITLGSNTSKKGFPSETFIISVESNTGIQEGRSRSIFIPKRHFSTSRTFNNKVKKNVLGDSVTKKSYSTLDPN